MEVTVMSISPKEQQALASIEDGLAGSDPKLASLLATFTRLASDEEMPVREKIRATRHRAPPPPHPPHARPATRASAAATRAGTHAAYLCAWAGRRPFCCCGSPSPSRWLRSR